MNKIVEINWSMLKLYPLTTTIPRSFAFIANYEMGNRTMQLINQFRIVLWSNSQIVLAFQIANHVFVHTSCLINAIEWKLWLRLSVQFGFKWIFGMLALSNANETSFDGISCTMRCTLDCSTNNQLTANKGPLGTNECSLFLWRIKHSCRFMQPDTLWQLLMMTRLSIWILSHAY